MMMNPYKFLHFVKSKSIPNWSVQYADEEDLGFTRKYPMARIGSLLTRKKEPIDIQDGVIYKRVTISTKDGNISIRDEKDGKDIRTKKQFIIHEGQFLLSKIDARNGAYGVVPVIAENAIITVNFWTFDVDYDRINPQFLTLVTKTKQFLSFAEKSSNGTTNRHYLQETAFLNQQIPLPSLEEQEKILTEYNLNYGYYLSSLKEIENEKVNIGNYIIEKLSLNTKDSKGHSDNILNLQTSVIRDNKPNRSPEHPTMKPVTLCAKLIYNSSLEGDTVLDPFGGSGSTLIASQINRKACLIELEPKYCDVIVKRYKENYPNAVIKHIRNGVEI